MTKNLLIKACMSTADIVKDYGYTWCIASYCICLLTWFNFISDMRRIAESTLLLLHEESPWRYRRRIALSDPPICLQNNRRICSSRPGLTCISTSLAAGR